MPDEGGHDQIKSFSPEGKSNNPLLQSTILNKDKDLRIPAFEEAWKQRWNTPNHKPAYFGTNEQESPFSQYSSRGWKIHIAFEKGKEKDMAKFLFTNGLYFKVEGYIGSYFNGKKASGATIYIGSYDNMAEIANMIEQEEKQILTEGAVAISGGKRINIGSGSDIELKPNITARFDIAKTAFGWHNGNGKYAESGISSWTGLGGIPILKKYEAEVSQIENNWNKNTPGQRDIYFQRRLRPIYEESKAEIIKDFGQEFVFGNKSLQQSTKK